MTLKVVCIGDSETLSIYGEQGSWTSIVARELGWQMINKGIGGNTSAQMLARFQADVLAYTPDFCIITAGAADTVANSFVQTQTISNIDAMVQSCKQHSITPVIGSMFPLSKWCPEYRNESGYTFGLEERWNAMHSMIYQYAKDHGLGMLDFWSCFYDAGGKLRQDLYADNNIHTNEKGNSRMAFCGVVHQ